MKIGTQADTILIKTDIRIVRALCHKLNIVSAPILYFQKHSYGNYIVFFFKEIGYQLGTLYLLRFLDT